MKKDFKIISHAEVFLLGISALLKRLRSRITAFRDDFIKTEVCEGGFTLIELLVVVLIIGILSAVALPQYTKAVEKSRMAEAMQMVNSLEKAVESYHLENPGVHLDSKDIWDVLPIDFSHLRLLEDGARCSKYFCYSAWHKSNYVGVLASRCNSCTSYIPEEYALGSNLLNGKWERYYHYSGGPCSWKGGDIFGTLRAAGYEETGCD